MPCFAHGCQVADTRTHKFTLRFGQFACLCPLHSSGGSPLPAAKRLPMLPPCCTAAGEHHCLQQRYKCSTCEGDFCELCATECHKGHTVRCVALLAPVMRCV